MGYTVQVVLTNKSHHANATTLPFDYYPGGQYDDGINLQSANVQNVLIKYGATASHIRTFSFVPTPSALDIGGGNVALTHTDYLARYIGSTPPVPPRNTPFQNFITAFNANTAVNNEEHIDILRRNGDWVAAELNAAPIVANCSFMCANGTVTVTGPSGVCTNPAVYTLNNAPAGAGVAITWASVPTGIVNITPAADGRSATVTRITNG